MLNADATQSGADAGALGQARGAGLMVPGLMVIDDFLPHDVAEAMLAQIMAAEPRFTPSQVGGAARDGVDATIRVSRRLPGRVGVDLTPLTAAIDARIDEICAGAGVARFAVDRRECSIVAHGDGDFYRRHVDTRTDGGGEPTVRVVSCVYYLHAVPCGFAGGELAVHPLAADGPARLVAPRHNRLAVFPSFIPHEVMPVRSDGGFAQSRFSVNCWLRRAKTGRGIKGGGV